MPSFSGNFVLPQIHALRCCAAVALFVAVALLGVDASRADAGVRDPAGPTGRSALGYTQYEVDLCRNHADAGDPFLDADLRIFHTGVTGETVCSKAGGLNPFASLGWTSGFDTFTGSGPTGVVRIDPPTRTHILSADVWRKIQANPRNSTSPTAAGLVATFGRDYGANYRDQYHWELSPLDGCFRPADVTGSSPSSTCGLGSSSTGPTATSSPDYKHIESLGSFAFGLAWVTACADPRTRGTASTPSQPPRCDWYASSAGGWHAGPGDGTMGERIDPSLYGSDWNASFGTPTTPANFGSPEASVQLRRMRLLIEDTLLPTSNESGLLAAHRPEYYVKADTPPIRASWNANDNTGLKTITTTSCANNGPTCALTSSWKTTVQPTEQQCDYMRLRPCPETFSGSSGVDPSQLAEGEHKVVSTVVTGSGVEQNIDEPPVRVDKTAPNPPGPQTTQVGGTAASPTVTVRWSDLTTRGGEYAPLWWLGAQRCNQANSDASCVAPVAQSGNNYPASLFGVQQTANGLVVPVPASPRRGTLRFFVADSAGEHYGGIGNVGDYVAVPYNLDDGSHTTGPVIVVGPIDHHPVPWVHQPTRPAIVVDPVDPNRPIVIDHEPFIPVDPNRPQIKQPGGVIVDPTGPWIDVNGHLIDIGGSGKVIDKKPTDKGTGGTGGGDVTATGNGTNSGRDGKCDPYDGKLASGIWISKISQSGRGKRARLLVRGTVRKGATGTVSLRINARKGLRKLRKKALVAKVTGTASFSAKFALRSRLKSRDTATLFARYNGDKKLRIENVFVGVARKVRGARKAKAVPTYNDPDCWPLAGKSSPAIKISRSSQQRKRVQGKTRYRISVAGRTDRRIAGRLRIRIKGKGLRGRLSRKTRYVRLARTGTYSVKLSLKKPLSRRAKLTVEVRYPGDTRFNAAVARRQVKVPRR